MKRLLIFSVLMLLMNWVPFAFSATKGDIAPAFGAASTQGDISLEDYKGLKRVVLAFYYQDFTGG